MAQDTLLNGRYRLISQQGSGGMAVIYKAQDLALGRTVAVKILRPSLTGDSSFLARFKQEARNVANLAHPNIVTLYDVGQDGNTYYMVMEYIEGQELKRVIRTSAPFTVERALNIAIQICAGIGYAHRAGLVHADVKPQNVLVTADDHVKVTDFGITQALSLTQPQERQSVVWGSPHYFAPEQASGEVPTPASDVYSIGIVMFEMLTGKLPYNGADQQELALAHIRDQIPHVMEQNPSVPVHLDRIIYKVMSKETASRYRTADQLGRILISYQKQGTDVTDNVGQLPVNQPNAPSPLAAPTIAPRAAPQVPIVPASPSPLTQPTAAPQIKPGTASYPTIPRQQPQQPQQPNYPPPAHGAVQANNNYPPITGQRPPTGNQPVYPKIPTGTGNVPAVTFGQTGQQPRSGTGGMTPVSGPYVPLQTGQYDTGHTNAPDYQLRAAPTPIDLVSVILAFIAFLAVLGLLPLWLAVWNTWTSAPH